MAADMRRAQKYHLGRRDLLPLAYWERRYGHKGLAPLLFRVVVIDLAIVLALVLGRPEGTPVMTIIWYGLAFRLVFQSLYELGYFVNDYLDPSEGGTGRSYLARDGRWLIPTILVRLVFAAGLTFLTLPMFGGVQMVTLLVTILLAFALHNALPRGLRVISYSTLQLLIFLSPLSIIEGGLQGVSLATYLAIVMPAAIALSVNYWMGKGLWKTRWVQSLRGRLLLLNAAAYLASAALACIGAVVSIQLFDAAIAAFSLALVSSALWAAFTISGFMRSYNASFHHQALWHTHTYLSHDAQTTIRQLDRFARDNGLRAVHLTDHAEDFSAEKFAKQARAVNVANRVLGEGRILHGLEYDILNEHFLCLEMRQYVPFDVTNPALIEPLKAASHSIIWAHPRPALGRLVRERAYRRGLARLLLEVDGIELVNFKSVGRPGQWWRHIGVGFLGYLLSKSFFVVGSDVHNTRMIARYGNTYPHGTLWRMSDKQPRVRQLRRFATIARWFGGGRVQAPSSL